MKTAACFKLLRSHSAQTQFRLGGTMTPLTLAGKNLQDTPGKSNEQARMRLLGRWADAREVAYPIPWLGTDEVSCVTGSVLAVDAGQFTERDNGQAPKLALDFLLRPATMTLRQLPVPSFLQDGENPLGDGNHCCVGGICMAVWFMRWLRCADTIQTADGVAVTIGNDVVARLPGEEVTLFRAEIATDAARMRTPTKIVETTCCTRDNVRMR